MSVCASDHYELSAVGRDFDVEESAEESGGGCVGE